MTPEEQRRKNNSNVVKQTLLKKIPSTMPRNTVLHRTKLLQYISPDNLSSGTKYGYLQRERRGFYIITTKLDEQEES